MTAETEDEMTGEHYLRREDLPSWEVSSRAGASATAYSPTIVTVDRTGADQEGAD